MTHTTMDLAHKNFFAQDSPGHLLSFQQKIRVHYYESCDRLPFTHSAFFVKTLCPNLYFYIKHLITWFCELSKCVKVNLFWQGSHSVGSASYLFMVMFMNLCIGTETILSIFHLSTYCSGSFFWRLVTGT